MVEELPERLFDEKVSTTFRPNNPGAEKWLYRPIECLDKGFVYLADYSGNDEAIVRAARVSLGNTDPRSIKQNKELIRYLRAHRHTSPFEMVEFKFHCKLPIFVARQWIRHRTASVNEQSGRYSVLENGDYLPEGSALRRQSKSNKQGGDEELSLAEQQLVLNILQSGYNAQESRYRHLLSDDFDLARETARLSLTVATYTQWYWKIDLHNLMHFLSLRLDPHAQYEIRVYAEAMARIIKDAVPLSWEAFEDYQLQAMQLSKQEQDFLKKMFNLISWSASWLQRDKVLAMINEAFPKDDCWKGEKREFIEKLTKLGILSSS
ncbi:MAG: FAD-dependent thymidylate synthase [Patescibacteria group bacterium]